MKTPIPSIQARLRAIAQQGQTAHQLVLIRYFTERLMYRLSASAYRKHFCLKGGSLLYAHDRVSSHPTMDLDLLGLHIASSQEEMKPVFQAICQIECPEDGLIFLHETLEVSEIQKESKYSGVRIKIEGRLGNIRQVSQVDIGFGDIITPAPVEMIYPTLLPMPAPSVLAYPLETVIAEKFEAMISLAAQNSRMKDFYDVYTLLKNFEIDPAVLRTAIQRTFRQRETLVEQDPAIFSPAFANNPKRQQEWDAFLKKIERFAGIEYIPFKEVMQVIQSRLQHIYMELRA